ncbi:isoprenylcysteine carboxylmethyltransferase family protein [Alphaproteobacteria bacterium]|nr:isoprenylcysteine carboxylmethyltransferase family protein [Alphaproteobacteria bacterium]
MARGAGFPDLPPLWTVVFVVASVMAGKFLPLITLPIPFNKAIGIVFALAGVVVIFWSALWFRRKKTAINPYGKPSTLIVEGPYRINRNPIYTGMFLIVVGSACWVGALSSIIIAFVFPWLITHRFIKREEAALSTAFGEEADAYFKKSRRW